MGTHHNPEISGTSDDEIRRMIRDEVVATIREVIYEMFGSIETTLIETLMSDILLIRKLLQPSKLSQPLGHEGLTRCCTESSATRSRQGSIGQDTKATRGDILVRVP